MTGHLVCRWATCANDCQEVGASLQVDRQGTRIDHNGSLRVAKLLHFTSRSLSVIK